MNLCGSARTLFLLSLSLFVGPVHRVRYEGTVCLGTYHACIAFVVAHVCVCVCVSVSTVLCVLTSGLADAKLGIQAIEAAGYLAAVDVTKLENYPFFH